MESRKRKHDIDENQVPKSRRLSTSTETDTDSERSATPLVPLRSQSRNSSLRRQGFLRGGQISTVF